MAFANRQFHIGNLSFIQARTLQALLGTLVDTMLAKGNLHHRPVSAPLDEPD